jgi:hypothetical protein
MPQRNQTHESWSKRRLQNRRRGRESQSQFERTACRLRLRLPTPTPMDSGLGYFGNQISKIAALSFQ